MQFRFYQGTDVEMIECRCPSCGKGHERMLFYTGYLPARIYCWDCYRLHFDKFKHMIPDEEYVDLGF